MLQVLNTLSSRESHDVEQESGMEALFVAEQQHGWLRQSMGEDWKINAQSAGYFKGNRGNYVGCGLLSSSWDSNTREQKLIRPMLGLPPSA